MIASAGKRTLEKIARCIIPRPSRRLVRSAESCIHHLRAYSRQLNSQTISSKIQFDINQTKFLALLDRLDLLGKKRKNPPEADKDNEQILRP